MLKKLCVIFLGLISLTACANKTLPIKTDDLASATVKVVVNEEASLEKTVYFDEGDQLLEVMREYFLIETEDTKYGEIITSIDEFDIKDAEDGAYWIYKVNNERSTTSAKEYPMKEGDFIEWQYWSMIVPDE